MCGILKFARNLKVWNSKILLFTAGGHGNVVIPLQISLNFHKFLLFS